MKHCMIALFALLLLAACGGKQAHESDSGTVAIDSDSVRSAAQEVTLPRAAEELFDDFFFNFASNARLQRDRIAFPLPVITDSALHYEGRKGVVRAHKYEQQWRYDPFFLHQDFYTIVLDSPEQMALTSDTTLRQATVERIMLQKGQADRYLFCRQKGRWMLCQLQHSAIASNRNASFIDFYRHFVSDEAFKRKSLAPQIAFVGPDPDNDFGQTEGIITPETWDAFAPTLPTHILYNIVYGKAGKPTHTKILVLRGIANGQEMSLTFERRGSAWKLTKLVM